MDPTDLEDGAQLSEEDLAGDPLIEGAEQIAEGTAPQQRVIVPENGKRGAIQEDGTVRIAIMRPCVSRGKRIRGLPPIYTPQMLAENAQVFTSWPMYVGHLHPKLQAKIMEIGRSPADLGGRILKSWYDPELIFEDDEEFGFRKGGVVGDAIPYELAESILSRDPHGLHASVNAWPRSARVGTAPWNSGLRGVIIEGIRSKPVGSVDWVVRGGAGGRVDPRSLSEGEQAVITILESCYGSPQMTPKFEEMTPEQLTEWFRENRSDLLGPLAESLTAAAGGAGGGGGNPPDGEGRVPTLAEFQAMMQEAQTQIATSADEIERRAEEKAEQLVQSRETFRESEKAAHKIIREAEIPNRAKQELLSKYALLPSGATPALICEAEVTDGVQTKDADEVLEARVKDDIQHYADVIRESTPGPTIRRQGGGGGDPGSGNDGKLAADDPLVEFLRESGYDLGDDREKWGEKAVELIREGAVG